MAIDIDLDSRAGGPILDGQAPTVMHAYAKATEDDIAERGAELIRNNLNRVLKHQTGFYRSHIRAEHDRITDGGIVYGPWLEGVGSRNRTTRFKGYFTFRRTTQEIEARSGEIAERKMPSYLRRLD